MDFDEFDVNFTRWKLFLLYSICVITVVSMISDGELFFYSETLGQSEIDSGESAPEEAPDDYEETPGDPGPSKTEGDAADATTGPSTTETDEEDGDSGSSGTDQSSTRYISIEPNNSPGNPAPANFSPSYLIVEQGTTVVWTNNDINAHQLTSSVPASTNFPVGQIIEPNGGSFEYQFDNAGTFDYYCAIHPQMTGQVTIR